MVSVVLGALLFASAAILGIVAARAVCARIEGYPDGPEPVRPNDGLLVAGAALIGGLAIEHGAGIQELGLLALATAALVGATWSDLAGGVVPDIFTLVPLAALGVFAVAGHHWPVLVSAAAVGIPFALTALLSRGRGMGWGDVKLAALLGAVVGMETALLACAAASIAAFVSGRARRLGPDRPIAFAPYLVTVAAVVVALRTP